MNNKENLFYCDDINGIENCMMLEGFVSYLFHTEYDPNDMNNFYGKYILFLMNEYFLEDIPFMSFDDFETLVGDFMKLESEYSGEQYYECLNNQLERLETKRLELIEDEKKKERQEQIDKQLKQSEEVLSKFIC